MIVQTCNNSCIMYKNIMNMKSVHSTLHSTNYHYPKLNARNCIHYMALKVLKTLKAEPYRTQLLLVLPDAGVEQLQLS